MFLENTPITRFVLLFGCLSASFFSATGSTCATLILAASTPTKRDAAIAACIPSWMTRPQNVGAVSSSSSSNGSILPADSNLENSGKQAYFFLSSASFILSSIVKRFLTSSLFSSLPILPFLSIPFGPLAMNLSDGLVTFWMLVKLRELEKRWGSGRFLSFLLTMGFVGAVYAQLVLYQPRSIAGAGSRMAGSFQGMSSFHALNDLLRIFSCLGSLVPLSALVTRFEKDIRRPLQEGGRPSRSSPPPSNSEAGSDGVQERRRLDGSRRNASETDPHSSIFLWIALAKLVLFPGGTAVLSSYRGRKEEPSIWPRIGAFFLGSILGSMSAPPAVIIDSSSPRMQAEQGNGRGEETSNAFNAHRRRRALMQRKGTLLYRWILFFSIHVCRPLCRGLEPFFSLFNSHRNAKGVTVIHHSPSRFRREAEQRAAQQAAGPLYGGGYGLEHGASSSGAALGGSAADAAGRPSEMQAPGTRIDRVVDNRETLLHDPFFRNRF